MIECFYHYTGSRLSAGCPPFLSGNRYGNGFLAKKIYVILIKNN
jgi:hypothetical protein